MIWGERSLKTNNCWLCIEISVDLELELQNLFWDLDGEAGSVSLLLHDRLHFGCESRPPPGTPARLADDWSWPGNKWSNHSSHQFQLSNQLCLSAFTFLLNFQNSLLCKEHDRLGSGARKQNTRSLGSLLDTQSYSGTHLGALVFTISKIEYLLQLTNKIYNIKIMSNNITILYRINWIKLNRSTTTYNQ